MDYDGTYHRLFSNPELVEDLLLNFVEEDWVAQLDFSTLERANAKFHHPGIDAGVDDGRDRLSQREGDIIYRIQTREGEDAYLYLFLEFQSRQDKWMALRINTYVSLFLEQLTAEKSLTNKQLLPPVFALVLYNGQSKWRKIKQLRSLIDLPPNSSLDRYQPNICYYLIDESQYQGDRQGSLTGILFRLESTDEPTEINVLLRLLRERLKSDQYEKLSRDFSTWVRYVLNLNKQLQLDLTHTESLSEVQSMLSENLDKWVEKQKKQMRQKVDEEYQEVVEQVREQGIEQGARRANIKTLVDLLTLKFGGVSDNYLSLIEKANNEQLNLWTGLLLEAETIEAVFA